MRAGPLDGVRVVDATRALAGPFASMVLGDLGADVIKLEMPGSGDETRQWGPPFSTNMAFNRNKRSFELDFHTQEGQATCLELIKTADVFVENFRPGTMKRFNLDYDTMRKAKPDLIFCSISGYGQTGPMAHRPAIDLMIQAVSGLMTQVGVPDSPYYKSPAPVADFMGGFSAIVAIMGALMEREKTGEGRFLDIAMLDGMITLMGQSVVAYTSGGMPFKRLGNAHPLAVPYQSFETGDGEIVMAVTNEKAWRNFCSIEDFMHLAGVTEFRTQIDRNINRVRLLELVCVIIKGKPSAYWLGHLERVGIAAEPINSVADILDSAHIRERGTMMEVEYPFGSGVKVPVPGMPWRDVASEKPLRDPPALGQHNEEITRELNSDRAGKARREA